MNPWDRLLEESSPAWAAFCTYLELGPSRSCDKAFRKLKNRDQTSTAPGRWNLWSRQHRWTERARAWDEYLAQRQREETEKALVDLAKQRVEHELVVQQRLLELGDVLRDQVLKHKAAPVTDVQQFEVSGQGKDRVEKTTKVKAMKTSGLARLSEEYRDTMRQSVLGLRNPDDSSKAAPAEPKKLIPDWLEEALKTAQKDTDVDDAPKTDERALAGRP